jgi:hypothetical protein
VRLHPDVRGLVLTFCTLTFQRAFFRGNQGATVRQLRLPALRRDSRAGGLLRQGILSLLPQNMGGFH